jgi:flagellin
MSKTLEKLSSGLRINRAADDAAGLAISEKMRGQIKGLDMARKNAQDAISLIQTAEGALNEVHSILQRMRELAVQAASDTNTDVDRENIQAEIEQLRQEIDRIARSTEFNTKKLLNGNLESFRANPEANIVNGGIIDLTINTLNQNAKEGTYLVEVGQFRGSPTSALDVRITLVTTSSVYSTIVTSFAQGYVLVGGVTLRWDSTVLSISNYNGLPSGEVIDAAVARIEGKYTGSDYLVFQIGANEGANMIGGIDAVDSKNLGLNTSLIDVTSQDGAERVISLIDAAIDKVSGIRSKLGAMQNRLEHTIANLGVSSENLTSSESRIRDADMAKQNMFFTKQQILIQSGMAMLAQANTLPQNILQLLRG